MITYNQYATEAQLEVMKSFDSGWKNYNPVYQRVFKVDTDPSRFTEKFSVRGGVGSFTPVTDGAAYNQKTPQVVGTQTIAALIFKEAISITKMMKKLDNYGSAMADANQLGYYYRMHMDKLAADLLADATGATVTWDGLALAHASHLIGNTGTTQSNLVSGGLTTPNAEAAIQNFSLQKDHNGRIMSAVPVKWVVPSRNWMQSRRLLGSAKTPEDENNSINAVQDLNLELVVWPQLVTTDFEAMLLGPEMMHRLEYLVWYGPDQTADRDSSNGNDLVQLDLACNAGAVDYLGTYFITS